MSSWTLATRAVATTLTAGLVLGLAACAPSQPASGDAAASVDPAKQLDQLTVGFNGSLSTLDVGQSGLLLTYYAAALTQEGLVGIDADGQLTPALATSWEQPDDTTWVYELDPDATFSDGTPVTPADVVFSIDLARDPERSPSTAYYWPELTSVKATGEHQVTIRLAAPSATFGWTPSAAAGLFVTSQKFYESDGTYGSAEKLVLGTGPYEVTEFAPDSHVTYERNPHYRGDEAKFDTVRVDFLADANTRLLAFQDGSLDVALGLPIDQADTWQAVDGAAVESVPDLSYQGLTINPNVAPFDDAHVRAALAAAIDRESVVAGVLDGQAEVATGITSPQQLAIGVGADAAQAAVGSLPQVPYDAAAAKKELAASSVPDGFTATLTYPDSDPNLGKVSLAIAQSLEAVGITLDVKEIPVTQWSSELGNGEQGLQWMSYVPPVPTDWPTDWLLGPQNPAGYQNEQVFDLVAKAAGTSDAQERVDAVTEATALALEDGVYAPVYWGRSITAFGERVRPRDFSSFYFLTDWTAALDATA